MRRNVIPGGKRPAVARPRCCICRHRLTTGEPGPTTGTVRCIDYDACDQRLRALTDAWLGLMEACS